MSDQFEYDIAFSFLAEDEAIASRIADTLRERMKVFVYSEQQKELAGKDGLEEFTRIFRSGSRVCVILYREGWGQTKWTRVEETAIKDRAFDEGWDFLVVVALASGGAPKWLPKTKIWLGFDGFGLEGAAAVIDARVRESGGEPGEESARDRAERLARVAKSEADRDFFLGSKAGVDAARAEVENLFAYLQQEVAAIGPQSNGDVRFERRPRDMACSVNSSGASFSIGWWNNYGNTLNHSSLLIREYDGRFLLDGWGDGPKVASEERFHFTTTLDGAPRWYGEADPERLYTTRDLAEDFLRRMLDRSHRRRQQTFFEP